MNYRNNALELLREQYDEFGYNFCQVCKQSNGRIHVHHIFFRSEKPKDEKLHDKKNMIIVCENCHRKFHDNKNSRNSIIKERNLIDFFKI